MLDRNLAMEAVRVTEAAALASARLMGRGDKIACDQAAVDAMRNAFQSMDIRGRIVIGEGERDEAPMLFIGEEVGARRAESSEVDVAVDPLEGTRLCAFGRPGAISVMALADSGHFLHAPDSSMYKIAVGPTARGAIDLRESPTWNLQHIASAKGVELTDLTCVVLDRPRHMDLIAELRACGARIRLITDGDVAAALATTRPETGIDVLIGIGGAPEGVLAAAALKCIGGDFQGRLVYHSETQRARAIQMGVSEPDKIFVRDELARGDVMFAATGITGGDFLRGVRFFAGGAVTHSIVMRSRSGTVRIIEATHDFARKPAYSPEGLALQPD